MSYILILEKHCVSRSNMAHNMFIMIGICLNLFVYSDCKASHVIFGPQEDLNKDNVVSIDTMDVIPCTIEELDDSLWTQCGNRGYMMNCSYKGLIEIPKKYPALNETKPHLTPPLCALNLDKNTFQTLRNNSFTGATHMNSTDVKWLKLTFCSIQYIEMNAFLNLSNLLFLNLTGNSLTYPDGFSTGVFSPLITLTDIQLFANDFTTFNQFGQEMKSLKQLERLGIDLCQHCTFGEGWEQLLHLTILELSHPGSVCNATALSADTFKHVYNLRYLSIRSCNVHTIAAETFLPLKELEELDMSDNERLHFEGMNTALYGLRNSTKLRVLQVNKIHPISGLGEKLENKHMKNLKTLKALERINMDQNKIEILDDNITRYNGFPKTVTNISLARNRFSFGTYIHYLGNTNFVHIDISQQHVAFNPFFYQNDDHDILLLNDKDLPEPVTVLLPLPQKLESLKFSQSLVHFEKLSVQLIVIVIGGEHLKYVDLSFNFITSWSAIIDGFQHVTYLDLSKNNCDDVIPMFFDGFRGVNKLNISHNYLNYAFDKLTTPEQAMLFSNLTNLTEIDLSSNQLTYLNEDMFKNLSNIKRLYVNDNLLTRWSMSLEKSRCLEILNLKNNKLDGLEQETTEYLDSLMTEKCNHGVHVDLSDNPLNCDCPRLDFLRWIRHTKVIVKMDSYCLLNGKRYYLRNNNDLENVVETLEHGICKDLRWVVWVASGLSGVGTCFLCIIGTFVVYKNRWKLRYLYYTRHRRHIIEGYDRLFQYDVFISYPRTLGKFIKTTAVPMLEGTHELRTWVYDRDSVPGSSLAETVTHAINNSKKAVLLVNRDFLKDSWCEYETTMANVESITTGRKMIIVVMIGDITMGDLPLYLSRLFTSERHVEYPDNEQDENTFWANLAEEIRD